MCTVIINIYIYIYISIIFKIFKLGDGTMASLPLLVEKRD